MCCPCSKTPSRRFWGAISRIKSLATPWICKATAGPWRSTSRSAAPAHNTTSLSQLRNEEWIREWRLRRLHEMDFQGVDLDDDTAGREDDSCNTLCCTPTGFRSLWKTTCNVCCLDQLNTAMRFLNFLEGCVIACKWSGFASGRRSGGTASARSLLRCSLGSPAYFCDGKPTGKTFDWSLESSSLCGGYTIHVKPFIPCNIFIPPGTTSEFHSYGRMLAAI